MRRRRPEDVRVAVERTGPWRHRYVSANGSRFHVVECLPEPAPSAPLVLLLHGFPAFWWSWRHQLPALAQAGWHVVAMDLRGYGGSDKTPEGYDPFTLASDVAGMVKALGERTAVVAGQGWGGYVGWAAAALHPREVSALATFAAPHPRVMLRALSRGGSRARRHVLAMQVPWRPERRLADPGSGLLAEHLTGWSATGSAYPSTEEVATYQQAISLWPASHCALEYHRWLVRSRVRSDGRRFDRAMRVPIAQPVLTVGGEQDPAVPASMVVASGRHVSGPFSAAVVAGAGHFPPEEQPGATTAVLHDWLGRLPGAPTPV